MTELRLTPDLLLGLLHLPRSMTVRDARYDAATNRFVFLIDGDELPAIPAGGVPRLVRRAEWSAAPG